MASRVGNEDVMVLKGFMVFSKALRMLQGQTEGKFGAFNMVDCDVETLAGSTSTTKEVLVRKKK